jgi:hypothetical protein
MNKRIIFEQADDLVSQVDALVETYIAANQNHFERIDSVNAMRENWLKVIRECEAYNILHCREDEAGKEPIQKSDLFKKFCVLFESHGNDEMIDCFTWRLLVIADTYLSPGQVVCFVRIVEYTQNIYSKNWKEPLSRSSYEKIFVNMSTFQNVR